MHNPTTSLPEHTFPQSADPITNVMAALRDELAADLARDAGAPERLLSIPEAAEALGIGRTALYAELMAGRCRSVKVGRRRLVPASAIAAYTVTT